MAGVVIHAHAAHLIAFIKELDMKLKCNSCDGIYSSSLDVRFTKLCDNDCSFCIERNGLASLGPTDVETMIQSTIDSGLQTILILGGEPFLQIDKLYTYVKGIRSHVKEIFITTSLPKQLDINNIKVLQILSIINGLNVSIQHHDPEINNKILIARSGHNRLEQLGRILSLSVIDSKAIRVSINLVKGHIDTKEKIDECLAYLYGLGTTHVKINELQNSNQYVNFESVYGMKLPSPYSNGCQYDIQIHKMRVTLKRSCFVVEESLYPSVMDIIKTVIRRLKPAKTSCTVMYEDGSISNGWR